MANISGCPYYLLLLDDLSHFCWAFSLRRKSEVYQLMVEFIHYVRT